MTGEDVLAALRKGFVSGLLVLGPLLITWLVLSTVYRWLTARVDPLLGLWLGEVRMVAEAIAILVLLGLVVLVGLAFRQGAGEGVVRRFDRLMEAIPVVRSVYSPTRQASTALVKHGDQFDRVVLVEWPREGVWTLGFVTDETPDRITDRLPGSDHVDVYLPMSPNPMGGYLTMIPRERVIETDLSVGEGFRIVVTSGLYGDQEPGPPLPK